VTITAEGVETPEQAEMLRKFGCRQVQGFLYGHPEAAEAHPKPKSDSKVTPIRARRSSAA
jgi:EAL domain-containing protein (putative c-di-GMP-specific phosphodiesterase class I)